MNKPILLANLVVVALISGCAVRPAKVVVSRLPVFSELGQFTPEEGEKPTTKRYPLADLVKEGPDATPEAVANVPPPLSRESFLAALKACVAPQSWTDVKEATVRWEKDHLVVTNLPSVVKKVETFIEGFRQERANLICVQVQFVKGRAEDFEKWDAAFEPLLSAGDRVGNALVAVCPTKEVAEWLAKSTERGRVTVLTADRTTTFPLQRFSVVISSQKSFVSSYETQVSQDGSIIAIDPVVAMYQDGLAFGERVLRVPGEQNFVLFFRFEIVMPSHSYGSALIPSVFTKEHKLPQVEIPNVWKKEIAGTLLLPADGSAVILTPAAEPAWLLAAIVTIEKPEATKEEQKK